MQLQREIGLESSRDWGPSFFGMREIEVAFRGGCI